ncbi:LacI family DNA-binding transcriptional regulator [Calorimonas adulescens]|jgi:family./Bacterial regulatory proteins, lacI family.|uniref:LacI family transcriptional regulator n=1 Tax=Calorimonas adulescens TaxID=2606906 RepID=A0A5D8QF36_9THEO|nr:LacI family DNA-binding transcriptional regulator [Calorimonas adulescens]TZE83185.1 LacI family transcriptional regulator [Calorimonas adulescens]
MINIKITIKDVAKRAGVSISTVSRVINDSKPVSDEAKQRVLDAIKETGYRPNQLARGLVLRKSNIIGMIIPDIANPYYAAIVEGAEEIANMYGYTLLLCNTHGELDKEIEYLNLMADKQADGLVFMTGKLKSEHVDWFKNAEIKTCFINLYSRELDIPMVSIDNYNAVTEAINYLISNGHVKIGMLYAPDVDDLLQEERLRAYKEALKNHGHEFDEDVVSECRFSIESGYVKTKELLNNKKVDALLLTNDVAAIGAMKAATEMGYRVPEDISIMGFDDISFSAYYQPSLTSINQPTYDMGAVATRMVIKQIAGEQVEKMILLPHKLVERESTVKMSNNI